MLQNSKILITGGTGSFGSELIKLLISLNTNLKIGEIRVLSREKVKQERFKEELELKGESGFQIPQIKLFCGDITDRSLVERAVAGCDYIFHAAALKDVTYCEKHPLEALQVNVYGTNNVIESAFLHKVKRVVIVSTDKAVAPAGTMGITKAMMERLALSRSLESHNPITSLIVIRFGNLMGSAGTVVPLFIKQVKEGKNLTVTNPQMTRFMMTLSQAAEYALFALENGNNGDIIIRNSPALSIGNLAKAVIEMYGSSSEIIITGARPGERMFEIMASEQEMLKAEQIGTSLYLRIPAVTSLNTPNTTGSANTPTASGSAIAVSDYLQIKELNSCNVGQLETDAIKNLLKTV
jgi:UDP-glucose 4-epimerase